MENSAAKSTSYGHLEEHKQAWLKSLALAEDRYVIDCEPTEGLITFQTAEGRVTRRAAERWTRCMGYYRPVSAWNIGKQQEHADRQHYEESRLEAPR